MSDIPAGHQNSLLQTLTLVQLENCRQKRAVQLNQSEEQVRLAGQGRGKEGLEQSEIRKRKRVQWAEELEEVQIISPRGKGRRYVRRTRQEKQLRRKEKREQQARMHLHENEMVNPRWGEAYDIPESVDRGKGGFSQGLPADPHTNRVTDKTLFLGDLEPAKTLACFTKQRESLQMRALEEECNEEARVASTHEERVIRTSFVRGNREVTGVAEEGLRGLEPLRERVMQEGSSRKTPGGIAVGLSMNPPCKRSGWI